MKLQRSLTLIDIVLMNLVAVVSLRWIASAASIGPSSISLWFLAALFFFLPQALAVMELSSRYPGEGGLYRWTQKALGESNGFICGWCYWVNNLLYFPGLLLYVSANIAFALQSVNPNWHLENHKGFVVSITLLALWMIAGLSIAGMKLGKWLQNAGAFGNWLPAIILSALGITAYFLFGSANTINFQTSLPNFSNLNQLSFWAQMCFALAGLELVSFLGDEIKNPRKTLTLGILISGFLILLVYIVPTIGILISVPVEKITLVNGILLPLQTIGERLQMNWIAGFSAGLIALGGLGTTMAWFAGASRVPYLVGVDRYLPKSFAQLHPKFQTPHIAILVQAAFATAFTLFATAGSETKMEVAYKTMVDMCLILYFIPYCYLFISLFKLRKSRHQNTTDGFQIPCGNLGIYLVSGVGLITTLVAIVTSVLPGSGIFDYLALSKTVFGTLIMLVIGALLYARGRNSLLHTN